MAIEKKGSLCRLTWTTEPIRVSEAWDRRNELRGPPGRNNEVCGLTVPIQLPVLSAKLRGPFRMGCSKKENSADKGTLHWARGCEHSDTAGSAVWTGCKDDGGLENKVSKGGERHRSASSDELERNRHGTKLHNLNFPRLPEPGRDRRVARISPTHVEFAGGCAATTKAPPLESRVGVPDGYNFGVGIRGQAICIGEGYWFF